MEAANPGADLGQFERWYTQPGTPTVTVSAAALDPARGAWTVTLEQACRDGPGKGGAQAKPFHVPVRIGLLDAATGAEALPSVTLELRERRATFTVEGVAPGTTAVVPSVLRGFSAPVRLVFDPPLADNDLAFLMQHDTVLPPLIPFFFFMHVFFLEHAAHRS